MTVGESKMKSNLIPITRIYDIYPKYTYSNDVKKFMDEIVDIDRANAFTKADIVDILDNIRAEIENHCGLLKENHCRYCSYCNSVMGVREILEVIDKHRTESEEA